MPFLSDKPLGEDGYYMLTVAWNIASGNGIAIRPGQVTTGIQPLATFIYAIFAWLVIAFEGDKFDFVRTIILFGGLNQILFALIMGLVCAAIVGHENKMRAKSVGIIFVIIGTSFYLFRTFTYGLETGIYLTTFASLVFLTFMVFSSNATPKTLHLLIIGVLAGITGLARIDFGVIFATFLFIMLVLGNLKTRSVFIIGITALVIVLPWLAWVKAVSGNWMPSSGPAQAGLADLVEFKSRFLIFISALEQNIFPSLFTGGKAWLAMIASVPVILCLYLTSHFFSQWKSHLKGIWVAWLVGCIVLLVLYPIFFWATHFYARYTVPILVVFLPIFSAALLFKFEDLRLRSSSEIFSYLPSIAAICLLVLNAGLAFFSLHTGKIGNSHSVSAGYIKEHIPPTALVGAFQSGVIGYFNENIINLDGKVNSDALDALRKGQINSYIMERGIDFVVDWDGIIQEMLLKEASDRKIWERCKEDIPNGASICIRKSKLI